MLTGKGRSGTLPVSICVLVVLGICIFLPFDPVPRFYLSLAIAYAIAVVGLDLFSGYVGQPSFGQGAFIGIGAYATTVLRAQFRWPVLVALLAALILTGLCAGILGAAMVRLRHFGAGLSTFFFAFFVLVVLSGNTLDRWTHSEVGLQVPQLEIGQITFTGVALYIVVFVCLVVAVVLTNNYANSRSGWALRLVKQSELVASVLGVDVSTTKLVAFVYAGVLAGLSGFFVALVVGYLAPESFDASLSIQLFGMGVVGGLGSIAGPILGACFFTLLPPFIGLGHSSQAIIFAAILLVSLLFLPEGFYGVLEAALGAARRDGRRRFSVLLARWTPRRRRGEGERLDGMYRNGLDPAATEDDQLRAAVGNRRLEGRDSVLTVNRVTVRFGGLEALSGVELTVAEGSTHAVIGPNGAGKTTLLNCVSAVQRLAAGSIALGELRIDRLGPQAVRRLGVARTFQNPSLIADLSVLENVMLGVYGSIRWMLWRDLLGGPVLGARRRRTEQAAHEALDLVRMPVQRRHMLATSLTLAEQRMVDVARAMAGYPHLLLMDEPTSGLDDRDIERIRDVIQHLKQRRNVSVVVISHHFNFVLSVADRVTVLDFGRGIADGPPGEVAQNSTVIEAFIGAPTDLDPTGEREMQKPEDIRAPR